MFRPKIKYHLRLFLTGFLCIWFVIGLFAYLEYRNKQHYRELILVNNVAIASGNILYAYETNRAIDPFLSFLKGYLQDSPLAGLNMAVYSRTTGELLYSLGPVRDEVPDEVKKAHYEAMPDSTKRLMVTNTRLASGEELFLYASRVSKDGTVEIRIYLPYSSTIDQALAVDNRFWLIILFVGLLGSVLVWVFTMHQARNVKLLRDFAARAANDREFIPMGDFPSDEIGDISRQVVAIYNSRMQANVRREREHAIAIKAVEEKNNMRRVLTNNISHELKTPIGIVRSYLEMILGNPDMSVEERTHFLQKAQQNVERLVLMMNDLSTMTRLDEKKKEISMSDIDFHELVFSIADDVSHGDILRGMEFRYNIPLDCHVWGNGELLNSVITNLIRNAAAYSQGTEMGIKLLGRNDNFYTFSFYDNGVGVGEEHLIHLFERFYRVDTGRSRKVGGTGLGLPIVKSSFNTMGGSITVRNREGGGLEFIFTLRRCNPKAEEAAENDAPDSDAPETDLPRSGVSEGDAPSAEGEKGHSDGDKQ